MNGESIARSPVEEQGFRLGRIFRRPDSALVMLLLIVFVAAFGRTPAQESAPTPVEAAAPEKTEPLPVPAKVDVQPVARDSEIRNRLQRVMDATGWFRNLRVDVEEGVVFISGIADSDDLKKWAGDLARNTQDVAAVANRIQVARPSIWDFSGAQEGLSRLGRDIIRSLPFVGLGLIIMALSGAAGLITSSIMPRLLQNRIRAKLLRGAVSWAMGFLVFLVGTYIVLRVSGLTQLALTIVGGTGLVGLALGIAFREITENFLASIFLSMQRPFETGDTIEVAGIVGIVQQLSIRTTVLMAPNGNLIQVPNSMVYKSVLTNYTSIPNRREDFTIGVAYGASLDHAQEVARKVLEDHPAVLTDPEPMVLVDSLNSFAVNMRIYFWLDGNQHSPLKVRSSIIRLVKAAFQAEQIAIPDGSREMVFPKGVAVTVSEAPRPIVSEPNIRTLESIDSSPLEKHTAVSTRAEGGLVSEASTLNEQAQQAKPVEGGENLLKPVTPPETDVESESAKKEKSDAGVAPS